LDSDYYVDKTIKQLFILTSYHINTHERVPECENMIPLYKNYWKLPYTIHFMWVRYDYKVVTY